MTPMQSELAHGLTLIGLILATLAYGIVVRNRRDRRFQTMRAAQTGLAGLVRVMVGGFHPE